MHLSVPASFVTNPWLAVYTAIYVSLNIVIITCEKACSLVMGHGRGAHLA